MDKKEFFEKAKLIQTPYYNTHYLIDTENRVFYNNDPDKLHGWLHSLLMKKNLIFKDVDQFFKFINEFISLYNHLPKSQIKPRLNPLGTYIECFILVFPFVYNEAKYEIAQTFQVEYKLSKHLITDFNFNADFIFMEVDNNKYYKSIVDLFKNDCIHSLESLRYGYIDQSSNLWGYAYTNTVDDIFNILIKH